MPRTIPAEYAFALATAERDIAELKRIIAQARQQRAQLDAGERRARARLAEAERARAYALKAALGDDTAGVTLARVDEYLQADDPATVAIEVVE